jgi:hypothetical protein
VKSNSQINEQGGWCKHASKENGGAHITDKKLVLHLSEFLKGKRVASFGDGPGAYKRELTKLGDNPIINRKTILGNCQIHKFN